MVQQKNRVLGVVLTVYTLFTIVIVSTLLSDRLYIPAAVMRMRMRNHDLLHPSPSPLTTRPRIKQTSSPALPSKMNSSSLNLTTTKPLLLQMNTSRSNSTPSPLLLAQVDHSGQNQTSVPHTVVTVDPSRREALKDNKQWKDIQKLPKEKKSWVYNKTAADMLRKELVSCCGDGENFIVTKKNHPINSTIQYDAESKSRLNVSQAVLQRFPDESPLKKYARCSMVGSSGILNGSGCGHIIDSADFVLRCNMAPVGGVYKADVGQRTHLITMNPTWVQLKYKTFKNKTMKERYVHDLSTYQEANVVMTPFSYKFGTRLSYKVQDVMKEFKVKQKMLFVNPDFSGAVNTFWKRRGVKAFRASTGLFLVTAALRMCEEVHMYGFWPWHLDRLGRNLTQHYYDNQKVGWAHNFAHEFRQFQNLHDMGVLHLTSGSCT